MSDDESKKPQEQERSESPVFTEAEIKQASELVQVVIAHCEKAIIGFGDHNSSRGLNDLGEFCVGLYGKLLDEIANAKRRAKESNLQAVLKACGAERDENE